MDVNQTSSVLPLASMSKNQMVDNVMTVLPIELTNTTGTYLQHMNEDCLLEIFSSNLLTVVDLCSVAETCKRFKQIAQRIFSTGFVIKHGRAIRLENMFTFSSKHHSSIGCTFQDIERIFKNFGSHLSELYMVADLALVNLIARYCDDITLKRLEISSLGRIEGIKAIEGVTQLSSISQRLLQLMVDGCNFPIAPWGMNFDSLIELEIWFSTNCAALLRNDFPILERFRFYSHFSSTREQSNIEALSEFVRRHGCLKTVEICGESFKNCDFLLAISGCNELEELKLRYLYYASFNISHLQNLPKLKALSVHFYRSEQYDRPQMEDIDFSEALTSLKTVEISELGDRYANQIFDVLPQLQGLRELKLDYCDINHIPWTRLTQIRKLHVLGTINGNNYCSFLLVVIEQLINLEEFKSILMDESYYNLECRLSEEEFSKIVHIVQRRAHVLTLTCRYDFNYEENCNEKRKVKLNKFSC